MDNKEKLKKILQEWAEFEKVTTETRKNGNTEKMSLNWKN